MKIGMIGLGRMGANMARRLLGDGHEVVGYDISEENLREAVAAGVAGSDSIQDLVGDLDAPRAVWVMVPHGTPTEETIDSLIPLLDPDDVIVDGGNSRYVDSMDVARRCARHDLHFLDVGVSGGVWGLKEGYCMMIGGPRKAFERLEPIFQSLAPPEGYAHVGGSGAGHFVKMIHNAIEYAMLQAIGEGFEGMQRSQFEIDLKQVAELWQHGAVVRSWLLELLARAFDAEGNDLDRIAGYVEDSGMGRWSVQYAVENAIPMSTITQSLYERFDSRLEERFSAKVISALRDQFGGHGVVEED